MSRHAYVQFGLEYGYNDLVLDDVEFVDVLDCGSLMIRSKDTGVHLFNASVWTHVECSEHKEGDE